MEKLYLVDGMAFVFRAYHAMLESGLQSPDGKPIGAVFSFVNTITSILEKKEPVEFAVVFDTAEPTFRHIQYPEYKANRDEFPEDLGPQLDKIKKFLDLAGIPRIEMPGFEADDIIGTLAKNASAQGREVFCLTSDKDFYQLVDANISLLKPQFRGQDFDSVGINEVFNKFGVTPDKVIDVLALLGDAVDNIPGVKGVGEKTAIPLVQKYGTLEALYENIEQIEKNAVKTKLVNSKNMAFLSKELVTIKTDVDIENTDCKLKDTKFHELDNFFQRMGFRQIRKKWMDRAAAENVNIVYEEPKQDAIDTIEKEYILVESIEQLIDIANELKTKNMIALDLETSSLNRNSCEIVGIALSAEEGKAYYIPTDERDNVGEKNSDYSNDSLFGSSASTRKKEYDGCLPINAVLKELKPIFINQSIGKCGQNIKFDLNILDRYDVEVTPIVFDSMLASYVLNPDEKHGMDALAKKWLNYTPVPISALIGEKKKEQKSMRDLDPKQIKDYACEDADITLKLCNKLKIQLEKEGLLKLGSEVEFPMIEVLTRMERNGVAIDTESLSEMSTKIADRVIELRNDIYHEAGMEFNIDSPKQLGHILFEKLMLPTLKKTKTGFSTDVQVLTKLANTYEIANYLLEYRQIVKLKSTYVDALPKLIDPVSGRLHTTYNQTVASTGRLSSTDPNLQNIPIRSELGKEIRKAFVPGNRNNLILSADYSQVELRIMAHICGDEHMINGFKNGLDIHSATSSVLFGVPLAEVNSDMRRIAKTVNFGIMYGLGAFGLAQRLNIPRGEAKEIIDNYFEKYPGIRNYIDSTIEISAKKGYAETLLGRRRFFSQINSKNKNLRTAAERAAINMPIQGTASDMMKIAMININNELKKNKLRSLMMLQVHDELVFEVTPNELEDLKAIVIDCMQEALPLGEVPVVVDTGVGENWFEAH